MLLNLRDCFLPSAGSLMRNFTKPLPLLERELGVELFDYQQRQRRVVLTEAGTVFLLGLTLLPLLHPKLAARPFGQGRLAVALPAAHSPVALPEVLLKALAPEKWVETNRPLHPRPDDIEHMCQPAGFSRRGNIVREASSLGLLSNLVRLGIGIAFGPSSFYLGSVPGVVARPRQPASAVPTQCVAYRAT